MTKLTAESKSKANWRTLPRNVWAVSLTSSFMNVSSERVINTLPLFLSNVLGVKANSMRVDDLALFKAAYAGLGEQGKGGEVEERIVGRIAHKVSMNLGGR